MKNLIRLFVLISILSISCDLLYAQDELYKTELPLNDYNRIEFVEVIEVPNKSLEEIYILSKEWIVENYKSANDVIQMDEKDAGKIIVKGIFVYNDMGIDFNYHHTLKVDLKDAKVRISLGNLDLKFTWKNVPIEKPARQLIIDDLYMKNGKPNKGAKEQKEAIIKFWNGTKQSINESLNKVSGKKDNW